MTEGAQRPELPAPEDLPGTGTFAGYSEYIMLMEQCWDQDAAARPTFAQVNPLSIPPPFLLNLQPHFLGPLSSCSHQCLKEQSCMLWFMRAYKFPVVVLLTSSMSIADNVVLYCNHLCLAAL